MASQETCSISHQVDTECDRHLARLISYIHHTSDDRQYCHDGNAAQHCRLCFFQDSEIAGDFEDSKSTSVGVLCIFGSRTLVPIGWMCKKQASVSHSFPESEIIFVGCWLANGWITCSRSSGHGDRRGAESRQQSREQSVHTSSHSSWSELY